MPLSKVSLVEVDQQLRELKSPELIIVPDIVNFVHLEMLSLEGFLYGIAAVIHR